jgi:hypothetical protein
MLCMVTSLNVHVWFSRTPHLCGVYTARMEKRSLHAAPTGTDADCTVQPTATHHRTRRSFRGSPGKKAPAKRCMRMQPQQGRQPPCKMPPTEIGRLYSFTWHIAS